MKTSDLKFFALAPALILAMAAPASAQDSSTSGAGAGLLGQNYLGAAETYIRHNDGLPTVDHDLGFIYNQAFATGLDANANYDWLTGSAFGTHDWRQQALFGLTGYLPGSWVRPFVQAEGGWAWQRINGFSRNGFTYLMGAGAEFQPLKMLAISPYADYQEWHRLNNPAWGNRDWNFGLKTTYRLSVHWSLTLNPQIDQHRNPAFMAGLNFHY